MESCTSPRSGRKNNLITIMGLTEVETLKVRRVVVWRSQRKAKNIVASLLEHQDLGSNLHLMKRVSLSESFLMFPLVSGSPGIERSLLLFLAVEALKQKFVFEVEVFFLCAVDVG